MNTETETESRIEWDEEIDGPAPRVPGRNRFYPPPRGVRAVLRDMGRWARVVPNRADRRRAGEKGKRNA